MKKGIVILVYGAKDEEHNEALVLKEWLQQTGSKQNNHNKINDTMKKILIALDYNPSAQKVAEMGHELASSMKAKTILLHVISDATYYSSLNYSPIMGFESFNNAIETNSAEELKMAAKNYLDKSKEYLNDQTIQTIVRNGVFAETILNTAKEQNVDIIVMGTHSRRGLEKILMGSVAENVLHHSPIPVFIIPTKGHE